EDCIRDFHVTGVQTCALPIYGALSGALDGPVQAGAVLAAQDSGDLGDRSVGHLRVGDGLVVGSDRAVDRLAGVEDALLPGGTLVDGHDLSSRSGRGDGAAGQAAPVGSVAVAVG